MLTDKTILITGGTGSMGRRLVSRIVSGEQGVPRKVIVFSRDEAKQHEMRLAYQHRWAATDEVIYRNFLDVVEFRIGDIRNFTDVCSVLRDADIVIHAAAMKQVPTCEYFPAQAVLTNCAGATNIVLALEQHRFPVQTVVGISTDKACKAVNVMGMTKAIQERIFTSANILNPNTRFVGVRYGNVLASRGSVIPLFHEQIRKGGPVTITHREMTRFLLSLDQAVDTILSALKEANRGEIYVPKVSSAAVLNIATALIGHRRIEITFTGCRPGEKIHEILISEEEANRSFERGNYYAVQSMLPELQESNCEKPTVKKEFSSTGPLLDLQGTISLLKKHNMMIDDVDSPSDLVSMTG